MKLFVYKYKMKAKLKFLNNINHNFHKKIKTIIETFSFYQFLFNYLFEYKYV